jgi:hypothetical protein
VTPKLHNPRIWTPRSVDLAPRLYPDRRHMFEGHGQLVSPEGDVLWEDPDWIPNALHDAGENSMLQVYLAGGTNPTKFLALLNDGTVAETDGTMQTSVITEAQTPGSNGYARISLAAGSWSIALQSGDYRADYPQQTFGPASGSSWTLTHAAVNTNSATAQTASELLLATIALSGTTTVNIGQSFLYTLRWTQQ